MNIASEIFKRLKQANKLAAITGCLLSIVSTIFTCRLLASFAQDGADIYLYYAFGIGIQAAQSLSLFYAGFLVFTGRREKATFPICIFILLFVLSLCGTIGFMAVGNDKQKVTATHSSDTYEIMKGRLTSLEDQIQDSQSQIKEYTQRSWLSRGVEPESIRLDNLMAQREEAYNEVTNFTPKADGDALYRALGGLTGADSESCKRALFFMYAIALDLSSGLMLWMSAGGAMGGIRFRNRKEDPEDHPELTRQEPQHNVVPDRKFYETTSPEPLRFPRKPEQPESFTSQDDQPDSEQPEQHPSTSRGLDPKSGPTGDKFEEYKAAILTGMKPDGSTIGRAAIVDQIGISNRQAVAYHKQLKQEGKVRVENQRTYPLFGWEEVQHG